MSAGALIVGSKTLEITDSHRLLLHLELDALTFALLLLWADTTAHCWEARCLLDGLGSLKELALLDMLDECRDIDAYRTALHT